MIGIVILSVLVIGSISASVIFFVVQRNKISRVTDEVIDIQEENSHILNSVDYNLQQHYEKGRRLSVLESQDKKIDKYIRDLETADEEMQSDFSTKLSSIRDSNGNIHMRKSKGMITSEDDVIIGSKNKVSIVKNGSYSGDMEIQGYTYTNSIGPMDKFQDLFKISGGTKGISLKGSTSIDNGDLTVSGSLNLKGGKSVYNPKNLKTHFPWSGNGKNYIRGDTEISGDTNIVGNTYAGNLKLSNGWSGYPDAKADRAEISNDTKKIKKLMIVGNKSGDGKTRTVGVWDKLDVHGTTLMHGNANIKGDVLMGNNKWISHAPDDGRKLLYIARNNGKGWDWDKGLELDGSTGNVNVKGDVNMNNGQTIRNGGRLYIYPQEKLYLGPKEGVHITKDNGASGNLDVHGKIKANSIEPVNGRNHDWMRIDGGRNGTAMYNGVSINGGGGLAVGKWQKVAQGHIHANTIKSDNIEAGKIKVGKYINASEVGTDGNVILYTGWENDKTVLGNNTTFGLDYVNEAPSNSVISTNDHYFNNKIYANDNIVTKESLCINDLCLNEDDIKKIKNMK